MLPAISLNYRTLLPRFFCIVIAIVALTALLQSSTVQSSTGTEVAQLDALLPDGLSAQDERMASELTGKISTEWLGPLAPIAISPFFGLACLCAMSQYGESLPFNSFISDNPVLQNPAVLWTFVILTIVTSLPRLTKVSKPVAQAIDQLEAWSGIITILILRFAASSVDPASETALVAVPMLQCGVLSMSADVLFSIAAIANILVINTVKFFFEVSVWLIPFPFVDAMLEAANKSVCAGLMAVYAWSPFWATVLNGVIFLACVFAFRWVKRQVTYMRSILFDPLRALVQKSYGLPKTKELTVFPQKEIGPFVARQRLQLIDRGENWELLQRRLLFPSRGYMISKSDNAMQIDPGLIVNRILVSGDTLLFTRRHNDHLPELAKMIGASIVAPSRDPSVTDLAMDGA